MQNSWNCVTTNSKSTFLKRFAQNNKISIIAPIKHTHYLDCYNNSDILDIALIKNLNKKINIYAELAMTTDHLPIHVEIETTPPPPNPINFKIFK